MNKSAVTAWGVVTHVHTWAATTEIKLAHVPVTPAISLVPLPNRMRPYFNFLECSLRSWECVSPLFCDLWIPRFTSSSCAPPPPCCLCLLLLSPLHPLHLLTSSNTKARMKGTAWEAGLGSCTPLATLLSLRVLSFPLSLCCPIISMGGRL